MPKKKKSKMNGSTNASGDVIRNQFVSGDGSDPTESLKSLQEIFRGKLDADVVQLVFSECGFNVDQALESLFTLTPETPDISQRNAAFQERLSKWALKAPESEPPISPITQNSSADVKGNTSKPPQYTDTHFYEYLGNRSPWTAVSNSSDSSSANEADSTDSRHRHLVDVVCHKADSFDLNAPGTSKCELDDIESLIAQRDKILIVLRGLPGSGKSTLAKRLQRDGIILSTDDYFNIAGKYQFNPGKLSEAHEWNKERAIAAIKDGLTPIIIDNTNTESWEMLPYVSMATKNNYTARILEPDTAWKFKASELARRNVHCISKDKIARMLERYEHGLTVDDVLNKKHPKKNSSSGDSSNNVQQRLCLEDLKALALQDSDSASRRTSASSSQDTSGWEADEEFTWTKEELESISAKYSRYFAEEIPEEEVFDTNPTTTTEWSMPSYPVAVATESPAESTSHKQTADLTTQTTTADFICLQKTKSSDFAAIYPDITAILSRPVVTATDLFVPIFLPDTRNPPLFDKSTMTDEIKPDLTTGNKLKLLSGMFPTVSVADLEDILQKCLGDHNWAINNLLDFGSEYNDPEAMSKQTKNPIEIPIVNPPDSNIAASQLQEKTTDSRLNLVLPLDAAFAIQMEEIFNAEEAKIKDAKDYENIQITIPLDVAHSIYKLWAEQYGFCAGAAKDIARSPFKKNKSPTKVLNIEQNFGCVSSIVPSLTSQAQLAANETIPLSEIMVMEARMQEKQVEKDKQRTANGEDLATRLKRKKLYALFPGVDPQALDNIFESNDCRLAHTLVALEESLGHGPNGSPLFSAEVAQEMNEELLNTTLQDSQQEHPFFDDDWQSWVADDNSELINFPNSLLNDTGYSSLRAEATVHYEARKECYRKGQEAFQRGMKAVASFYSREGRLHTQKIKEANLRAANKILEIRNDQQDPNILDLHGLHVDEAILALEQYLNERNDTLKSTGLNKLILFIVTGRGLHSANKQPKIKPRVEEYLQRKQFRFDAIHDGLFKVILT